MVKCNLLTFVPKHFEVGIKINQEKLHVTIMLVLWKDSVKLHVINVVILFYCFFPRNGKYTNVSSLSQTKDHFCSLCVDNYKADNLTNTIRRQLIFPR